jgi:hypothetical protein
MSVEMPEATILARQMQAELPGKSVAGFELRDCESRAAPTRPCTGSKPP